MRLTDEIIESKGFKPEYKNGVQQWFNVELDAKGFTLRWIEELKDYYIEPTIRPTARIKVDTVRRLYLAYELITNRVLYNSNEQELLIV